VRQIARVVERFDLKHKFLDRADGIIAARPGPRKQSIRASYSMGKALFRLHRVESNISATGAICMPSAENLVILLHGVGACGTDLAPLGVALRDFLPNAVFAAPDAPNRFDGGGSRRQWFSVVGIDTANRMQRVEQARAGFDRIVAQEIEKVGFGARLESVAFFGFSQGAIMSIDAIATGRWPIGAIVAASGRLVLPPGPIVACKTPVLLLHGERDNVVPAQEGVEANRILKNAGFEVEMRLYPELGHTISPDGLQASGDFLAAKLARLRTETGKA
jgi:phospholipase/carboxylesterase